MAKGMCPVRTRDIHWIAGLIEGDGCFFVRKGKYNNGPAYSAYREYPGIDISMTDEDVVKHAHQIAGGTFSKLKHKTRGDKSIYSLRLRGKHALSWMMTLFPLMGRRRQAKLKEILLKWRTSPLMVGLSAPEVRA